MRASEIAGLPIQLGAAVRHRRLFHPTGVLANGTVNRIASVGDGLPVASGPVVGRISKALGTADDSPDLAGLAWRMSASDCGTTAWDVLLATAGVGNAAALPNRLLLRPVRSWSGAVYSSLMPLRYDDQLWWVRARLITELATPGLCVGTVDDAIRSGGLSFDVEQARSTGSFELLARLSFSEVVPTAEHSEGDIAFDPVRNSASGVQLWPNWLRAVRRQSYRSSREGRGAERVNNA